MAEQMALADETTLTVDDEAWTQLIELTDGAAAPCFQCGTCTAVCPWGTVHGEPVSIRRLIRQAQLGLMVDEQNPWLCTACGQCETYCPRGVPIVEVIQGLRYLSWERRRLPEGLPSVLWSVYWNNNPLAQPPSERSQWAKELELADFDPEQHEILLYIGCTASYDRRAQRVGRALVALLRAAGVSFGYLGDEEPCCGETVLNLGHKPFFEETIQRAAQLFRARGVGKLVTVSPHCYDVFRNHWPGEYGELEAMHYTQYLAWLIEEGRLEMARPVETRVTYHDPCFLARHNGEVAGPRQVLQSIPGLTLAEMGRSGPDTLCCGGGGGRMWLETKAGERFADGRIQEALSTGATILATACPFCIACLEDSLKGLKERELTVMDVAEIAALSLVQEARP